jgi:hypothetical protein
MQLKQIARDALLKPLQAVSGIVERRHTLPILANVLLEQKDGKLYVTATDLEMQITAVSDLAGKDGQATTVGARKLQDLLRALPDDATVTVDASGGKMSVRAGRSRFNLQTLAASDYPRIAVGQEQLQTLSLPQPNGLRRWSDTRISSRFSSPIRCSPAVSESATRTCACAIANGWKAWSDGSGSAPPTANRTRPRRLCSRRSSCAK